MVIDWRTGAIWQPAAAPAPAPSAAPAAAAAAAGAVAGGAAVAAAAAASDGGKKEKEKLPKGGRYVFERHFGPCSACLAMMTACLCLPCICKYPMDIRTACKSRAGIAVHRGRWGGSGEDGDDCMVPA